MTEPIHDRWTPKAIRDHLVSMQFRVDWDDPNTETDVRALQEAQGLIMEWERYVNEIARTANEEMIYVRVFRTELDALRIENVYLRQQLEKLAAR